ncbi:MAG: hypothetical protein HRF50_07355 [Phycisphaerae bacterium]|jgi:hypothetical protein
MHPRFLSIGLALLISPLAIAQKAQPLTPTNSPVPLKGGQAAAAQPKKALSGEEKVRLLMRALNLTAEQRQHAAGLFDMYFAQSQTPQIDLDRVHVLVKEMEEAKKAGDQAREQAIQEELRQMGQKSDPSKEFLENLRQVLNDQQKADLKRAEERLARNPSGEFQPVDVLRAAIDCGLTAEQQRKFDAALSEFRKKQNRRGAREDREARILEKLLDETRALLTPEQVTKFDTYIDACRT